ncbi:MAG TPA: hypothetical protein VGR61_05255, partial [Candidatus Dormibacteraeota bacterium]|nr:hypothetical protein [Candidatus Dormibacteraeota bacterium]
FELAVGAGTEMRQTHDPRLLLELTLLKLATGAPAPPVVAQAAEPAPAQPTPPPPATVQAPAVAPAPAAAPPEPSAPPSTVATAPNSPAPPPATPAELAEVRALWPTLLGALRGSAPATRLRALLNDASPLELDDDLLTIGFRFAMLSEKAQEPLHRAELEKAMSQVYGRTFRLGFKVIPDLQPVGAPAGAPGPPRPGPPRAPLPVGDPPSEDEDPDDFEQGADTAVTPAGSPAAGTGDHGGTVSGEKLVEAAVEVLGARITDIRPRQRPV